MQKNMKMICKRILIALFISAVFLSSFSIGYAGEQVIFSSKAKINEDTLKYSVGVSENSEIAGLTLTIQYNPQQIEFSEYRQGDILSSAISNVNADIKGKVILSLITTEPLKNGGDVLSVDFYVKDGKSKNIDLEYSVSECIDIDCNEISIVTKKSEVENLKYITAATSKNDIKPQKNENSDLENNGDLVTNKEDETISNIENVKDNETTEENSSVSELKEDIDSTTGTDSIVDGYTHDNAITSTESDATNKAIARDISKSEKHKIYDSSNLLLWIAGSVFVVVIVFIAILYIKILRRRKK